MNGKGVCSKRYKESVINSFLIRANKICSTKQQFYNEIDYIKRMLTINNYNPKLIKVYKKFYLIEIKSSCKKRTNT